MLILKTEKYTPRSQSLSDYGQLHVWHETDKYNHSIQPDMQSEPQHQVLCQCQSSGRIGLKHDNSWNQLFWRSLR